MTIKFVCTCGKHLKARDDMAGRRSACPRCGSPVGIPSLRPTHAGTSAAPLTPTERMHHARERPPLPATPAAAAPPPSPTRRPDTHQVRLLSADGVRRAPSARVKLDNARRSFFYIRCARGGCVWRWRCF